MYSLIHESRDAHTTVHGSVRKGRLLLTLLLVFEWVWGGDGRAVGGVRASPVTLSAGGVAVMPSDAEAILTASSPAHPQPPPVRLPNVFFFGLGGHVELIHESRHDNLFDQFQSKIKRRFSKAA